jgi:hypothetical protein
MTTTHFYFTGPVSWAKLKKPDDYQGQLSWKINVYLDKKGLKTLQESELRVRPKKDDNGTYVTFKRSTVKEIKGEEIEFDPPTVLDKNNEPLDRLVGNGSVATVKVSVFDTRMGKGHRLESVRVEELVEYEGTKSVEGNAPAVGLPF